MSVTTRLTKVQLLARIAECEAECAAHIRAQEALRAELALYQQTERPSRHVSSPTTPSWPVVTRGGVRYFKVRDDRTRIVTYKPVPTGEGESAARSALRGSQQGHAGTVGQAAGVYPS